MRKEEINTTFAPAAIGPYSQGIKFNNLVFTSGQLPIDPNTGEIPCGIENQTKIALNNLAAVINAAGSEISKILKVTIFLKDMNDFNVVNKIYSEFFSPIYPARSCVQVARLPKDVSIEIEAIAFI